MADRLANSDELSVESLENRQDQDDAAERLGGTQDDAANGPGTAERRATPMTLVVRLRLLWNRRQFVLRAAGAGFVVSVVVAFSIAKQFQSTTRLMPSDQENAGMGILASAAKSKAGADLGTVANDLLGLKSSGALFVGILESQTVQDGIIGKFDLRKVYRDHYLEDARNTLRMNTVLSEDRKSGIITIQVTDKQPQRAAAIAQEYVQQLDRVVTHLNTTSAHRERVFLEDRLRSVKQDLDDAETQLAQFSSKNNTLDIQQQGKAMLDAAATLAGQMIAAQSELAGLRQIYTNNNARVRALNARVEELRNELNKLRGADGRTLTATAKSASLTAADPPGDLSADMPYPSIHRLPLLGAQYADYYRHTKIQETVFELLTEQSELAKVEEAKETPSVQVLDTAQVPERKSYPPRLMMIFVGTLTAFGLSVFWVLGTARWRALDLQDERKALLKEVVASMKTQLPFASQNGAVTRGARLRSPDLPEGESGK